MSESKTSPLFSSVQLLSSHKEINLKAVVSVKYNINGVLLACACIYFVQFCELDKLFISNMYSSC